MTARFRRLLLFARVLALASGLALAGACGNGGAEGYVELRIPEGASARRIAANLEDAGLVGYPSVFALYASLRGSASSLKAGLYRIPACWSAARS